MFNIPDLGFFSDVGTSEVDSSNFQCNCPFLSNDHKTLWFTAYLEILHKNVWNILRIDQNPDLISVENLNLHIIRNL